MLCSFRNHLHGENVLRLIVYDRDLLTKKKIGSVEIDLKDLEEKDEIDNWYNLLPSQQTVHSAGEIHLILRYRRLQL